MESLNITITKAIETLSAILYNNETTEIIKDEDDRGVYVVKLTRMSFSSFNRSPKGIITNVSKFKVPVTTEGLEYVNELIKLAI